MIAALPHPLSSHTLPIMFGAIVVACLVLLVINRRMGKTSTHVDGRARHLVGDKGIHRYTDPKHAPKATQGLGPGPLIGQVVGTGQTLRATFESVVVMVAGARTGKTTTIVVPAILDAPGPVLATSNKGDIVAATRGIREQLGPVWLFDPQGLAGSTVPTFWWDPLDTAGTVAGARTLAALFADANSGPGSARDAYFDPEGRELLAMLLLAAAADSRPLTAVYGWVSDQRDDEAVALLTCAGHQLAANGLRGVLDLPDKQKAGVYGTAKAMVAWVADPALTAWVVNPGDGRPRFDAETFTATRATLYSLSKEGPGSAGALTLALTAAVLAGAERKAARSPAGRLTPPLVAVLDEVANVVRWQELPALCSHYGSRGIVVMSFLQSWSQAVECWGREGARKLWSSANVRVYGGGVSDPEFLAEVSDLCGEHDSPTTSASYRNGQRTTSTAVRRQRVFDVATLAALPPGRAVVMLSGARPVLVKTQSCYDGPLAEKIRQSELRSRGGMI